MLERKIRWLLVLVMLGGMGSPQARAELDAQCLAEFLAHHAGRLVASVQVERVRNLHHWYSPLPDSRFMIRMHLQGARVDEPYGERALCRFRETEGWHRDEFGDSHPPTVDFSCSNDPDESDGTSFFEFPGWLRDEADASSRGWHTDAYEAKEAAKCLEPYSEGS